MATRERPLSPHLQVYRWQYSMTLSILHRLTGVALSVASILLVYWLVAIASGGAAYEQAAAFFAHPLIRIALAIFSFCFFYHFANGVRHLVWDLGIGLERKAARTSGWIAFVSALVVTVVFWLIAAARTSGGMA